MGSGTAGSGTAGTVGLEWSRTVCWNTATRRQSLGQSALAYARRSSFLSNENYVLVLLLPSFLMEDLAGDSKWREERIFRYE